MIGLGLDTVEVDRFARVLARRPTLEARVFTDGERRYARDLAAPSPSLAARFAAKEAVMKALGVGLGAFDWHDVEVVRTSSGRPELVVGGRAAALADALGIGAWLVSLTHTDRTASAVVAALA